MTIRALLLGSFAAVFACGSGAQGPAGPAGAAGPEQIFLPADAFAPLTAADSLTTVSISGVDVTAWSLPPSNGQRGGAYAAVVVPATSTGRRPTVSATVYTPSAGRIVQPLCVNYLAHDAVNPDQAGRCFAAFGGPSDSITATAGSIETATAPVLVPEAGNISPGDVYVVLFSNGGGTNTAGTVYLLGAYVTFP